ncbi:hypothetical protein ACL02O_20310 [Micromonospora sp. MS34]|uniref:hypothetical protein n=1 Tax=Micromonospora sp. MS34 TaxID=3385971 RepID=UPI0039A1AD0F
MKIVSGDYNGDGRDDLAALHGYSNGTVRMFTWPSTTSGGFNPPSNGWSSPTEWTFNKFHPLNRYN